jgi:threonine aldolase
MTDLCLDFSSDNITPVAPEIMDAIIEANHGTVHSYGEDRWTERLTDVARQVFECDLAIYPVGTGTAANSLALAVLASPYSGIYCHEDAHIETDECGAPEFYTGGAKLIGLPGEGARLTVAEVARAQATATAGGVHHVPTVAVSISQATEWGTVYAPDDVAGLAEFGRAHRLRLHMDGARFANAVTHLGCSPAEASWKAGVDVLSLGATKNGALGAEAVVFFNPELAAEFESRRKRAGQLFSKMRFISAQLVRYLEDGLWLRFAAQANRTATRLARGLEGLPGVKLIHTVQANELFVVLPEVTISRLQSEGYGFYRWTIPQGVEGSVVRLVTAWSTTDADVDGLLSAIRRHSGL